MVERPGAQEDRWLTRLARAARAARAAYHRSWGTPPVMWPYTDVTFLMPVNPDPTDPPAWWERELADITGITIHHTLSHSPEETARHCFAAKGRPTLPYHFWVTEAGQALQCVRLEYGVWHDHTGDRNTNVSIGLAGERHKSPPPKLQMAALVDLVGYLMNKLDVPVEEVQGHDDRAARVGVSTVCPGWDEADWRERFYYLLMWGTP